MMSRHRSTAALVAMGLVVTACNNEPTPPDFPAQSYHASVRQPARYQLAGDTVRVVVDVPISGLASSIRASVGTTGIQLEPKLSESQWQATLSLAGQPLDTLPITDSSGATTVTVVPVIHDAPPTIIINAPLNFSVARPTLRYSITCTDDHPGCATFIQDLNGAPLVSGGAPGLLSFAHADGQRVSLIFGATDSRGQRATVARGVFVELSAQLDSIASGRDSVWDFDGSRILFGRFRGLSPTMLTLRDIGRGDDQESGVGGAVTWAR